jgi:hypothetical protein
MMKHSRITFAAIALLALSSSLFASGQRKRDPLSDQETDQIREAALKPDKRFHLYITFAGARLSAINQLRADPKMAEGRGQQIHDLLENFLSLVDETEDNLDDYREKKADLIKPLTELVEAESDWKLKLRALKEAGGADAKDYEFVLQNAMDAVNDSSDSARKELEDIGGRVPKEKKK